MIDNYLHNQDLTVQKDLIILFNGDLIKTILVQYIYKHTLATKSKGFVWIRLSKEKLQKLFVWASYQQIESALKGLIGDNYIIVAKTLIDKKPVEFYRVNLAPLNKAINEALLKNPILRYQDTIETSTAFPAKNDVEEAVKQSLKEKQLLEPEAEVKAHNVDDEVAKWQKEFDSMKKTISNLSDDEVTYVNVGDEYHKAPVIATNLKAKTETVKNAINNQNQEQSLNPVSVEAKDVNQPSKSTNDTDNDLHLSPEEDKELTDEAIKIARREQLKREFEEAERELEETIREEQQIDDLPEVIDSDTEFYL